jgi:hypothetical protein
LVKLSPKVKFQFRDGIYYFISGLNPNRRYERIAALKTTAGSMPGEEGEDFEKAVREEADRIDAYAWK